MKLVLIMRVSLPHAISPLFLLKKWWFLRLIDISDNNYGIFLKIIAVFSTWILISLGLHSLEFFGVFIKSGHFCVRFSRIQSLVYPWLLCLVFLASLKWISFETRRLLQNIFSLGLIRNTLLFLLHIWSCFWRRAALIWDLVCHICLSRCWRFCWRRWNWLRNFLYLNILDHDLWCLIFQFIFLLSNIFFDNVLAGRC